MSVFSQDMLSSMIVAKEGQGDMAMSNALGSNVFDVNFGLGFPLLVVIMFKKGNPESAFSDKDRVRECSSAQSLRPPFASCLRISTCLKAKRQECAFL